MTVLMLDSGAFGAWARGVEIDLKTYCRFIKRHREHLLCYVNLDFLPGNKGVVVRTREAMEKSARLSYENLQRMHDMGLQPVPVFHMGEDWKWLARLVEDGEPYIGLSRFYRIRLRDVITWLDQCFTMMTDKDGKPLCKVHGFGVGAPELIDRYAWTTRDSTRWTINFGDIAIPKQLNGSYDYSRPIEVYVSAESDHHSRQFAGLHELEKLYVREWLKTQGISIYEVVNTSVGRIKAYVQYYMRLQEQLAAGPQLFNHRTLSLGMPPVNSKRKVMDLPTFKIVFAATTKRSPGHIVTKECGVTHYLLSYWDLQKEDDDYIPDFMQNGPYSSRRPTYNVRRIKHLMEEYFYDDL